MTLVAIERPDGLLVERLLDAGLRVLALHPNQVAATRDRFRASGGKSDRFDAFVLCELARTDSHRFRVLEPDSDQTKALRALTRAREDLVGTQGRAGQPAARRARAVLARSARPVHQTCDSPISLAFLERYPSPADARGLGEQRLAGVPGAPALLRRPEARAAARKAPPRARGPRRRARARAPAARSCSRWSRRSRRSSSRSSSSSGRSPPPSASTPTVAIFLSLFKRPKQRDHRRRAAGRDRRLPRALPHPRHARRRRRPSRRRDRVRQTQGSLLPMGLQQAAAPARSARWPTPPATGTPGRKTSTPPPAPAATTTPARSAPSAAPGAASSGAAGKTASPTTPPVTAPCNNTSRSPSPPRRAPCPTSAATQRMLGAAVTQTGGPQGRARSA